MKAREWSCSIAITVILNPLPSPSLLVLPSQQISSFAFAPYEALLVPLEDPPRSDVPVEVRVFLPPSAALAPRCRDRVRGCEEL
jgi:hypothetical protein